MNEIEITDMETGGSEIVSASQADDTARLVALVRLLAAFASQGLALLGMKLDAELVAQLGLCALAVAATAWVWWRNNNWTTAAQIGQLVIAAIKGQR